MLEIAAQIMGCLLIAALLGAIIGYIIGRMRCKSTSTNGDKIEHIPAQSEAKAINPGVRPRLLLSAGESKDDLKQISGVGPKLEKVLHELGIYTFVQISEFTEDNIQWLDNYLAFQGRIKRDNWIGQASSLKEGKETAFSTRYNSDK